MPYCTWSSFWSDLVEVSAEILYTKVGLGKSILRRNEYMGRPRLYIEKTLRQDVRFSQEVFNLLHLYAPTPYSKSEFLSYLVLHYHAIQIPQCCSSSKKGVW